MAAGDYETKVRRKPDADEQDTYRELHRANCRPPAPVLAGAGGRTGLPDDHSESEPPESISNSEVKRLCADGSVGFPHVRVGHRRASDETPALWVGVFLWAPQA